MPERITEAQFLRIYGETIDGLYGYVSRMCGGDRELAEDVTQEAWLRAVRLWRRDGLPDNPAAWLTTVSRNLILNHFRRREGVSIDSVPADEVLAAIESNAVGDSAETASLVNNALARLPDAEARLLAAFYYERLKTSQLAAAHGISERAVEGRLRRARRRLRQELATTQNGEGRTT